MGKEKGNSNQRLQGTVPEIAYWRCFGVGYMGTGWEEESKRMSFIWVIRTSATGNILASKVVKFAGPNAVYSKIR
jgi:hypothetical protein